MDETPTAAGLVEGTAPTTETNPELHRKRKKEGKESSLRTVSAPSILRQRWGIVIRLRGPTSRGAPGTRWAMLRQEGS